MAIFFNIITNVMLPILILIALGFLTQKKLRLDVRTFTKINIYLFLPAIIFTKIYRTEVTWQLFTTVLIYLTIIFVLMYALGVLIAYVFHYPRGIRYAFINSLIFFNAGNYGLPVVELAFHHNPLATTAQIFMMLIQNTFSNTFGVFHASAGKGDMHKALKNVLAIPTLYAVLIVFIIKAIGLVIPEFVMIPLENIAQGFIAMALISLGVQLAEINISTRIKDILLASGIRLILAPLIGLALVKLMGIHGVLAKSLIIGVSTPTAVNSAIIAQEYNNEPEYASQIVFVSTVISVGTISLLILIMEHLNF